MKWLKKFNELKSSAYISAAKKLSIEKDEKGNIKNFEVVDRLMDHAKDVKKLEIFAETDKQAEKYSSDIFQFSSKGNSYIREKHNYYMAIDFDGDVFNDMMFDWESGSTISIPLGITLLPADEECKNYVYDNYLKYSNGNHLTFYPLYIWVNLKEFSISDAIKKEFDNKMSFPVMPPESKTDRGSKPLFDIIYKDNSAEEERDKYYFWDGLTYIKKTSSLSVIGFNLEEWGEFEEYRYKISDVKSGNKFKKLLIDMFSGENPVYDEYGVNLHDDLERVILQENSFSSRFGFDLEDVADYFRQCNKSRFFN